MIVTEHVNLLSPASGQDYVQNLLLETSQVKPSVRETTGWADMAASATDDDIELVLWKRERFSPLMAKTYVPRSDYEIITGETQNLFAEFPDVYNQSDWPEALRQTVKEDVHKFLIAFDAKLPNTHYRLRLQAVSDDACRKFHQDRVFQRLIITYRGRGTVWRHIDDMTEHSTMDMDCVLLRGKREGRDTQILHKSPTFVQGQPPRLIMVIDVIPAHLAV